jgi:hypothetical protein
MDINWTINSQIVYRRKNANDIAYSTKFQNTYQDDFTICIDLDNYYNKSITIERSFISAGSYAHEKRTKTPTALSLSRRNTQI